MEPSLLKTLTYHIMKKMFFTLENYVPTDTVVPERERQMDINLVNTVLARFPIFTVFLYDCYQFLPLPF